MDRIWAVQFHTLLEKAGLPRVRAHDLRQRTTSLLIVVLSMLPKQVQDLLGQSTMDMTMDISIYVDASQQREMRDAFDRF